MRLLVVGASGHLGGMVARRAPAGWSVLGTFHQAATATWAAPSAVTGQSPYA